MYFLISAKSTPMILASMLYAEKSVDRLNVPIIPNVVALVNNLFLMLDCLCIDNSGINTF